MSRIYLSPPHMSAAELELIRDAFESNWIAPLGPHVDAFETEFAQTVEVPAATAMSSGSAALHVAVRLVGVASGDDVLVSDLTFSASANVITYVGAKPVFVDADLATWNLDPGLLEEDLRHRANRGRLPAALIAVDLYGQSADYDRILPVCEEYEISVIEDAAEALGATYRGVLTGGFGTCAAFSFNGNKIITTSGGGMLVSHDQDLIERAEFLATQARDPAPHYEHSEVGYNYRMSNILGAIGRGQLQVLEQRVAERRRNFALYQERLGNLAGSELMPEADYGTSNRWLTYLTIDPDVFGASREDVRLALEAHNIESRPIWKPMHLQPVFGDELLALPSGYVVGSHPSPLPVGRGRAPVPWTILEGASASAVTLFRMDIGVDAGPVLMQRMFDIPSGSNARALYDLVAENLSTAFLRLYEMHAGGERIVEVAQDPDAASYRARRTPADGHLDFEKPAAYLERLIRATSHPYQGAYTYYEGTPITVWETTLEEVPAYVGSSGQILLRAQDRLLVQASDRPLWIWDLTSNGQSVPVSDVRVGRHFGYRVEDALHRLEHAVETLGREANR